MDVAPSIVSPSTPPASSLEPSPWLTIGEAANRARVSVASLRRAVRAGKVKHARVTGRKVLVFRAEWIDRFIESATIEARR